MRPEWRGENRAGRISRAVRQIRYRLQRLGRHIFRLGPGRRRADMPGRFRVRVSRFFVAGQTGQAQQNDGGQRTPEEKLGSLGHLRGQYRRTRSTKLVPYQVILNADFISVRNQRYYALFTIISSLAIPPSEYGPLFRKS